MVGCVNDFLALSKKDYDFPEFMKYHSIIHQQISRTKLPNTKEAMDVAFKIANLIEANAL